MKKNIIIMALVCCLPLFIQAQYPAQVTGKSLVICWQHTVCKSENPCEMCRVGPEEMKNAYEKLQSALALLDIEVALDEQTDAPEGNMILVNGKGLDYWLGGKLVKRQCASCHGAEGKGKEFNALELDGTVYETIPADLVIKAGLLAASELYAITPSAPCCTEIPCQGCPGRQ